MTTRTAAQIGRSNNSRGKAWMRDVVTALRSIGYQAAEIINSHHRGDITGCGDIHVECKYVQSWEYLSSYIDKAEDEAEARELPTSVVWVKRHGHGDPLEGYCVQRAKQFWADRRELERLAAVELEYAALSARLAAAAAVPNIHEQIVNTVNDRGL
jgi:hypothetical protein